MKAIITRPDGTKIELDGTEAEVRNVLTSLSPVYYWTTTPYNPNPVWPNWYRLSDSGNGITLTATGTVSGTKENT